jgi:hypothetical protein
MALFRAGSHILHFDARRKKLALLTLLVFVAMM